MNPLARLRSLFRDDRGNVLMILGFAILPLTFATGMGIDYARAMKMQTALDAIADASALVAVSKQVMPLPDITAQQYALLMFQTQAQPILAANGVTLDTLTATAPTDGNGRRTASVTYTAESANTFAKILGLATLHIHGTSTTSNATAPNMDFYMLLDTSSSMALPTTTAGLAQIAASNASGCEFACHSTNDIKGTAADGSQQDLYGVAKSFKLALRIDDEGSATSSLTSDAQSTASKNGATYRMAISTFNGVGGFTTLQPLTANLTQAASTTGNLAPPLYYSNGCPTQACTSSTVGYNDEDTGADDAFTNINKLMPTPGTGLNGNQPQAVMFIITDGMRDEKRANGVPEIAFDPSYCTTIKNRGIRIAVLYTEYLPQSMANDSWSQTNVAPYLNQVEPALQACATPGLYTKVTTDQDITTALDTLFENAVATAKITK